MKIRIIEADLANSEHGEALITLIDTYARGPGGQSAPLSADAAAEMAPGLQKHPSNLILLAAVDDVYVGAAVCYWLFSTFAGKPFLNVHDLTVLPDYQSRGIGTAMLSEIEQRARQANCCKLTLEVQTANSGAQRLYERYGFGPWSNPSLYATKNLT